MGLTSSTPARTLTREQEDIKYLGDRMPFGDAELYEVYRAYFARLKLAERTSFLTDIGLLIYGSEQQQQQQQQQSDEHLVLLQAAEQRILPPNFGNRLYQMAFLRKNSVSEYSDEKDSAPTEPDDDYTRLSKLEAFFDGLSNSTRRGGKKTLKVLMDCCEHQHPAEETNDPAENNLAYATTTSSSPKTLVEPLELVTIGYRVALASAFLQSTANTNDEHQDIGQFFPSEDLAEDPGLIALADSLADCATKRKQRTERSSTPNPEKVKFVGEEDVQEWGEHVAPLLASAMASFLHMVFFPKRAFPPTRSNFEYPDLSAFESSLFLRGNSPLLFSLACMSPALTGQVRTKMMM
jgi:hypothetical protein